MENRERYQTPSPQTGRGSRNRRVKTFPELLNSCLHLLSIRPRSRLEIINHLKKYTSDNALINQIVVRLEEMHLVDDRKFAVWLIESRSRSRPRGKRLLLQELESKGIKSNTETLAINEFELARKALNKKENIWSGLSAKAFRLKAIRFLYSRGFSWEVIDPVIKKVLNRRT